MHFRANSCGNGLSVNRQVISDSDASRAGALRSSLEWSQTRNTFRACRMMALDTRTSARSKSSRSPSASSADAPMTAIVMGLVTMAVVAAFVGLVNSSLIRFVKFTAIAATLTTYIAIGGFAFILRPEPDGYISQAFAEILNAAMGPIPFVFIAAVIATLFMEYMLRKSRWGWQLRAVGSNEESARKVGVKTTRTIIGAYVIASLFVFLGSILLAVQLGIGDASQGVTYTLTGVTAVVLGGTSLMGGRGTYVGTLMGSVLLIQVLNATVFLDLDQTWQYWLQAMLILVAAVVYSLARSRKTKLKKQ